MDASVTFVGTATTILRLGSITLLTDPNFLHQREAAYLGYGLWSRAGRSRRWTSTSFPTSTRWCCHTCTATISTGSPRRDCRVRCPS